MAHCYTVAQNHDSLPCYCLSITGDEHRLGVARVIRVDWVSVVFRSHTSSVAQNNPATKQRRSLQVCSAEQLGDRVEAQLAKVLTAAVCTILLVEVTALAGRIQNSVHGVVRTRRRCIGINCLLLSRPIDADAVANQLVLKPVAAVDCRGVDVEDRDRSASVARAAIE